MRAATFLALRSLLFRWPRALTIALCLGLVIAIPMVARVVSQDLERGFTARSAAVPLVVGAKGSRFELVLAALYHRGVPEGSIAVADYERLLDEHIRAIPLRFGSSAQGVPIVGTSIELFEHRGLEIASGRRFALPGECVLGAHVAEALGLAPGDTLTTDLQRGYDLATAPAIELVVLGVLAPTSSPDDNAVFVDLETCWIIEGFAHGHDAASEIDNNNAIMARTDDTVVLAPGVQTRQRVEADDLASFHLHGDRADLPLSALLVFPADDRERAILTSRINATPDASAVRPGEVIDEMLIYVLRVRQVLDVAVVITALSTAFLIGLIMTLAVQLRRDELVMLDHIGAPRLLVKQMLAMELLGQIALAVVASAAIVAVVMFNADPLIDMLLSLLD